MFFNLLQVVLVFSEPSPHLLPSSSFDGGGLPGACTRYKLLPYFTQTGVTLLALSFKRMEGISQHPQIVCFKINITLETQALFILTTSELRM